MKTRTIGTAHIAGAGMAAASLAFLAACTHATAVLPVEAGGAPIAEDSPRAAVASAHPMATEAGLAILEAGGNAIDAALATAFMLSLVEPHASGPGGGGFLVYHDAATGEQSFTEYRETAPASFTVDHIRGEDGEIDGTMMRSGGLASGTPGMLRGLLVAHEQHGRLPIDVIAAPTIRAADEGFPVSSQLATLGGDRLDLLLDNDAAAGLYLSDGIFPLEVGETLHNPALAQTYRHLVEDGVDYFYTGPGAEHFVRTVRDAGGILQEEDLANYTVRHREPIRGTYRDFEIVTAGPPSAGGVQVLFMLSVLEGFDLAGLDPDDPEVLALFLAAGEEALILARDYVEDPAHMEAEIAGLLSPERIEDVRTRIDIPELLEVASLPRDNTPLSPWDHGNTTHLSIVDEEGNAVALTQTINFFFGSGIASGEMGFLMNNEMYDFGFDPDAVNFPEPGKIPRSSMTPVLVFRHGELVGTLGSPGGTRIPLAVARIISGKVDFGLSLQEAIDLPRVFVELGPTRISYEGRLPASAIEEALSFVNMAGGEHRIRELGDFDNYFGGAHAAWFSHRPDGTRFLEAAADPRRDGNAQLLPPRE